MLREAMDLMETPENLFDLVSAIDRKEPLASFI